MLSPVGDQVVGLGVADHLINRIVGTGDVEADFKPGFCRQHTENAVFKVFNHDVLPPYQDFAVTVVLPAATAKLEASTTATVIFLSVAAVISEVPFQVVQEERS